MCVLRQVLTNTVKKPVSQGLYPVQSLIHSRKGPLIENVQGSLHGAEEEGSPVRTFSTSINLRGRLRDLFLWFSLGVYDKILYVCGTLRHYEWCVGCVKAYAAHSCLPTHYILVI